MKKRKDGRYSKQVTIGIKEGKPVKKTVYGKTIKEVDKNYRDLMLLVDKGFVSNADLTLSELIDEWYRVKINGKIKTNTEFNYMSIIKSIKNDLGFCKAKAVTQYMIECNLNKLNAEYKSKATIYLQLLKAVYNYAIQAEYVFKSPAANLSVLYKPSEKRILTEDERKNVTTCQLPKKEKAVLYLLRYTGMRRGELFALSKSDINKKAMTIRISKTLIDNNGHPFIQQSTKTPTGHRTIPIFIPLIKPLFDYINVVEGEYLFLNKNNNFYTSKSMLLLNKKINELAEIGTDLSFHCFRHNFITECYFAGVDVKKLQCWVGHSDISTTLNIYTHLEQEMVKNGSEMNEYYGSQSEVKTLLKAVR